jgi:putative DNA primase/helicase
MVAYDNVSSVPDWFSDGLCRVTSGGGLSKRQLFTDQDEIVITVRRPALLTGIESSLTRADALDRAILVELHQIPKGKRRTEDAVTADFAAARPQVLGALLDAASTALRTLPTLHLEELPRLADFARWVEAGSSAFGWKSGAFLTVYNENRDSADEMALDASPIGPTLMTFMKKQTEWKGTPTELLEALNAAAGETVRDRGWPRKANTLSGHLKRIAPNLRRLGIDVTLGERESTGAKRRIIGIRNDL